jgi:hypothetical protein
MVEGRGVFMVSVVWLIRAVEVCGLALLLDPAAKLAAGHECGDSAERRERTGDGCRRRFSAASATATATAASFAATGVGVFVVAIVDSPNE